MLRDYQQDSVDAAWDCVRRKKNPCIVHPTGAGKSWVIAKLCQDAIENWGGRVVVLAHRKELVGQNAEKIRALLPGKKVGIYSAGMRKRDTESDVIVAGIQSVYDKATKFGNRHVCIVDECHRIDPNNEQTQYGRFISTLEACNPYLAVIGLSATPFRTGEGEITDGNVFHEIAYESKIDDLINRGFLCPLTNKVADNEVDMSRVDIRRGEFVQKQMEDAFLANVNSVVGETVAKCRDRKAVIVFCSGVEHAEVVANRIEKLTGEEVGMVTGNTLPLERDAALRRFKGDDLMPLRWLVNVNVLTEGFDATRIDCVVMMRATVSPGLFAQAIGRGFRVDPSKKDCLILDYGGNISRHGPINDPEFGRKKKKEEDGEAPRKECPSCQLSVPAGVACCPHCGHFFELKPQELDEQHDSQNQIISQPEWKTVQEANFYLHTKRTDASSRTLRVDYQIGFNQFISEYVCIEHQGYALQKASEWWQRHALAEKPDTIEEALELANGGALRVAKRILAKKEGKYWRILDYEFDEDRPEEWHLSDGDPFEEATPF